MANLRAIWDNRFFDAAALTPSSQVATLPAVNVQDRLRKRVWRTTGCAAEYLIANLGDPGEAVRPPALALALVNHNLTMDGQVRVQAAANVQFNPVLLDLTFPAWLDIIGYGEGGYGMLGYGGKIPAADLPWYAPEPVRIIYLMEDEPLVETLKPAGALELKNYWKISLADPANPAGYLEVGRVFLSYFEEWAYHWDNWEMGFQDDSEIVRSRGGQPWTDRRPPYRTLRFHWGGFQDLDKYWSFVFFALKMGLSRDWILDALPDAEEIVSTRWFTTLYGRFQQMPKFTHDGYQGISETELHFSEAL
jgi:hypothetical protein